MLSVFLYQLCMSFYRLLDPLRLDPDIPLRDGSGTVLQEALHKGNVITIVAVDLRCVPFSETVSADPFITQIITNTSKNLLDFSCGYGKDDLIASNVIAKTIVFIYCWITSGTVNMRCLPVFCSMIDSR